MTEELNAIDYLEKAYLFIQQAKNDKMAWKWVVLSLHGALYGFAICACKGTNNLNIVRRTKTGKEFLIGFDKALEKCQNPECMTMTVSSQPLQLTQNQKKSVEYLKDKLRNMFIHYKPMHNNIELHGLPQISIDILNIIKFLALETGNYVNIDQKQYDRIGQIIEQGKTLLEQHSLYKETNDFLNNQNGGNMNINSKIYDKFKCQFTEFGYTQQDANKFINSSFNERLIIAPNIIEKIMSKHGKKTLLKETAELLRIEQGTKDIAEPHQRDHVVHALLSFMLGIYLNQSFLTKHNVMADRFQWKIAGLFHDIGYPIEIANDRILKKYSDNINRILKKYGTDSPMTLPQTKIVNLELLNQKKMD